MSGAIVLAVAAFFIAQGIAAIARPEAVRAFLGTFASSPQAHFVELGVRIAAGFAFVIAAHQSACPLAFQTFGAVLVATSVALLFVPWHLHRRFAQWAVPMATRRMMPYAAGCLVAGAAILYGVALPHLVG